MSSPQPNPPAKTQNYIGPALVLSNPIKILEFLVFYAPVVLATIVFIIPTAVMEWKGAIYLALLIGVCFLRIYAYSSFNIDPYYNDNTVCTMVQYGGYGNSYISIFVITFTFAYLCTPMAYNGNANWMVVALLIFYLMLAIGIFSYRKCLKNTVEAFSNFVFGGLLGTLIPVAFYAGNSSKYLFFNEYSNVDVCSMPSKQTFKCNVYKNGQLIAQQ
jgi:hypothetical protein